MIGDGIPTESATTKLVLAIELSTGSAWTEYQRKEVGDLIRSYRFEQVAAALLKVQTMLKENGAAELSSKIYLGEA